MMKKSEFQFENPYLEELVFRANAEFDGKNKELEMNNVFNVQVNKSNSQNSAIVKLVLKTNINKEGAPFCLQICVASEFKWSDMDEISLNNMLNINAPALLLGYMRPIVASITNASCFPVYNLPFVNFTE